MSALAALRRVARNGRAQAFRAQRRLGALLRRTGWGRRHAGVVTSFDSWAYADELARGLSELLARHGVAHLILDAGATPLPQIALRKADTAQFVQALADAPADWWLAPIRGEIVGRARWAGRAPRLGRADGVMLVRNLLSPSGVQLTHTELGVAIGFWEVLTEPQPRSGGSELPAGTLVAPATNGILDYLDAEQWQAAQRAGHRLPPSPPHLLRLNEPVDLVYTWVDGSDPAWEARKAAALNLPTASRLGHDAAIEARFASRDELRYSLRSAEMFAGWARRIWIVTDRQRPDWLVPDDRLTVVDHREIFTDPNALPVFNSHAIESQLHHIDGLAEKYLYLNDDMLFGAPVRPEKFIAGNGVTSLFLSLALIDPAPATASDNAVTAAAKNNRALLEREFGRTITNKLWHTPQPHSRARMQRFEAGHPELFDTVMRSRFRSATDYSLTSSLNGYYAFATGQGATGKLRYGYLDLGSEGARATLELWLRRRDLHCFCVNDGTSNPATRDASSAALAEFFEAYFPLPSRWERKP